MSSCSKMFEVGATVLGYVGLIASWRRPADRSTANRMGPMLVIQACSDTDEGCHTPAASITIGNREGLLALRDAIDEALKEPANG